MEVIKKLGDRVEKEHDQYLRDSQRIEDRSATAVNGSMTPPTGQAVDFESLVGSGTNNVVKADTVFDASQSWDNDVWGSIFNGPEVCFILFELKLDSWFPGLVYPSSDIESSATTSLFTTTNTLATDDEPTSARS